MLEINDVKESQNHNMNLYQLIHLPTRGELNKTAVISAFKLAIESLSFLLYDKIREDSNTCGRKLYFNFRKVSESQNLPIQQLLK